jgi:hypothetical protein
MKATHLLLAAAGLGAVVGTAWVSVPAAVAQSEQQRARDKQIEQSVTYPGCNQVRAEGKAPLYRGQPGYRETMDGDGDGVACEPIR